MNQGWLLLVFNTGHTRPNAASDILEKSTAWAETGCCIEKPLERVGWAQKLGRVGPEGITRVRQTVLARVMETQLQHPHAGSVGKGISKGTVASVGTSVWDKVAPPNFTLMPENSVSFCMSLVLFKLLYQSWSTEGLSLNKSVHGPFRRNAWDSSCHSSHSATIPAGFHSQKLWVVLFLALEHWNWVSCYGAWTPHSIGGTSTTEISLLIFICHTWVWDQPVNCLCPSYQSWCGFFVSLVIGLLFS